MNEYRYTKFMTPFFRFLCLPCDFSLCLACAERPKILETQNEHDFDIVSANETETLAGEELDK